MYWVLCDSICFVVVYVLWYWSGEEVIVCCGRKSWFAAEWTNSIQRELINGIVASQQCWLNQQSSAHRLWHTREVLPYINGLIIWETKQSAKDSMCSKQCLYGPSPVRRQDTILISLPWSPLLTHQEEGRWTIHGKCQSKKVSTGPPRLPEMSTTHQPLN